MKGLTKIIIDIGPLAIFFIFYTRGEEGAKLQSAILPLMIATIVAILISYILEKKIPIMPTFGAFIILVFGGLTIYFNNEVFFKMKPTIINIIFAITLIVGKNFFNRNFLEFFFKTAFQLDKLGWSKLNNRWAYFFIFLAILNEIVWRTQPETTWVNFKVWGILPLTFIFTALQLPMINKHKI